MTSTAPASVVPNPEDFRIRVAADRRERMRARLLDAVLDLYQPGRGGAHLVIDDVIQTAGVSRGTFYKYFESLEEAVDELGERMAAGTIADFRRLFDNEPNAAARAVGGAAMAMVRAWHDPRWGGFTCRIDYVDYFARASAFDSLVRDALKEARDAGQMSFHSLDVAVDLIVGMTVEARRRLIRQPVAPRAYIDEMLECTFRGLDMAPATLAEARATAWTHILAGAPDMDWWSVKDMPLE
ncbi:MAG TPA: TetR/AcrR family transcriptional regulator [Rhizorhapis sp.]